MDEINSYAERGRALWQRNAQNAWGGRHGLGCSCLTCADLRVVLPTVVDDRRKARPYSRAVSIRISARRLGISEAEYTRQIEAGNRWCYGHKRFESRFGFGRDARNRDGLNYACSDHCAERAQRRRVS